MSLRLHRLILPIVGLCLFVEPLHARSGGDLAVCSVEVEGDSLTMPAGFSSELGANGEAICKNFLADVFDALEASRAVKEVPASGGDGLSPAVPIDIGVDSANRNWMTPVLMHFVAAVPAGRYRSFVLISRPDDHYVVEVTIGQADGSDHLRYYEFSGWVLPQLQ